jgi:hypothetical protein
VINCNQCGKINATGAVKCQSCGAPLSNMVDGGTSPRPASLQQPELPAWLESLRAGERSAPPANAAANFSDTDFVDENSLPSWMRAERNEARDNTGANLPVSARPASLPGPITDGESQPPTGISARSLLDEQALPPWIQEGQQPGPVSAQERIPASSLVQPESMPDWMKSLQRDRAPFPGEIGRGTVPPTSSQMPAAPQRPAGGPPSSPVQPGQAGFSARDLIDPQSLPPWMAQQSGYTAAAPGKSNQASSPSMPAFPPTPAQPPSSPVQPGQAGFSARDLIDPQSLPPWMAQQSGYTAAAPGKSNQASSPSMPAFSSTPAQPPSSPVQPGQAGFSARDLIDPQSLPSWMAQQSEQAGQPTRPPDAVRNPGATLPASSLFDVNSLPSWLQENKQGGKTQEQSGPLANQSFQVPSTTTPPAFGGNIAASSQDINAVPDWMYQANLQQPNDGFGGPPQNRPVTPQPNIYAGPPKVDHIRVPNRPRNEINPNDNSEVAANVFTSMLGVASSTPNYPMPSSQPPYQGAPGNPAQPSIGYPSSQWGASPSGSANYAGPGMGATPNPPSMSSNAPQGYTPDSSYGSSYQGGTSSSQMGNQPSASVPYTSNPAAPRQSMANAASEQKPTKKRGLFGAILDWLTH